MTFISYLSHYIWTSQSEKLYTYCYSKAEGMDIHKNIHEHKHTHTHTKTQWSERDGEKNKTVHIFYITSSAEERKSTWTECVYPAVASTLGMYSFLYTMRMTSSSTALSVSNFQLSGKRRRSGGVGGGVNRKSPLNVSHSASWKVSAAALAAASWVQVSRHNITKDTNFLCFSVNNF